MFLIPSRCLSIGTAPLNPVYPENKKAAEAAESLIFLLFFYFIVVVIGKTPMSQDVQFILLAR